MQTQSRILQAVVVLMVFTLIVGTTDAQKKKTKKTAPVVTLAPILVPPGDQMPPPILDSTRPTDLSIEIIDTFATVRDSPISKDEFVAVEVEPHPIQDIQSLVEYPEEAKKAGLEGKVIISALIDTSGKVIKVEIDRSDNPIFDESARKAVMKAKFTPAMGNGIPVRLWYTLPIVFKLNK